MFLREILKCEDYFFQIDKPGSKYNDRSMISDALLKDSSKLLFYRMVWLKGENFVGLAKIVFL